jgi:hypothetical protein
MGNYKRFRFTAGAYRKVFTKYQVITLLTTFDLGQKTLLERIISGWMVESNLAWITRICLLSS